MSTTHRWAVEASIIAMVGLLALGFPVLVGAAGRGHEAAFLPFMADVVEGVQGVSLLLLFGVGVLSGALGKAPPLLLGLASAATLPLWSAIDLVMGGAGHNLLAFEWVMYGFYGILGAAGAIIGSRWGPRKRLHGMSLHEACYQGRIDVVAQLLANGANPNGPADLFERGWISSAGSHPRPLNCVAIAWTMTEDHVEIAKLLIEHGAVVDDSVLEDHNIEAASPPGMVGTTDSALRRILEAARSR